ncbi:MAG: aromatic-ring-hydroxylating dioxygenase subunit beta [Pseudomonadota bacterium]
MTDTVQLQGVDATLGRAIAFVWREAELLDRKDYAAWGALWSEDGHYIVPIDPDSTDYASQLNYVYDDARMRRLRIERLTSGHSMSAADSAHTVRTVSRFTLGQVEDDVVEVHSAQLLAAYKRGTLTMFAANLTHRIRFTADGARLQQKVVRLINSHDTLNALGFLL